MVVTAELFHQAAVHPLAGDLRQDFTEPGWWPISQTTTEETGPDEVEDGNKRANKSCPEPFRSIELPFDSRGGAEIGKKDLARTALGQVIVFIQPAQVVKATACQVEPRSVWASQ